MRAGEILILRDIPREQAREEILQFFLNNPGSYPSDAALALRIDSEVARDLALEMKADGLLVAERH